MDGFVIRRASEMLDTNPLRFFNACSAVRKAKATAA